MIDLGEIRFFFRQQTQIFAQIQQLLVGSAIRVRVTECSDLQQDPFQKIGLNTLDLPYFKSIFRIHYEISTDIIEHNRILLAVILGKFLPNHRQWFHLKT